MKIFGIVSEYNPFHNGHAYHIAKTREILGQESGCVCVMSGHFVQRGAAAVLPKEVRAATAVDCGADLVLELPVPTCLSSAEGFAGGAVALLRTLGCVTHLSFGSEAGDLNALKDVGEAFGSPAFLEAMHEHLAQGKGYAQARKDALEQVFGPLAHLSLSPNNLLGIYYCKALAEQGAPIQPLTIRRKGVFHHDLFPCQQIASATSLRRMIRTDKADACEPYMPPEAFSRMMAAFEAGEAPPDLSRLDVAMMTALRLLPGDQFSALPLSLEGLSNRLRAAAYDAGTIEQMQAKAKTRRYTMSRIKRLSLCAFLTLRQDDFTSIVPFVRVLALNQRGRGILRRMHDTCSVPIVTKPLTAWQTLTGDVARRRLTIDRLAADLYSIALPNPALRAGGRDLRMTPWIKNHPTDDAESF